MFFLGNSCISKKEFTKHYFVDYGLNSEVYYKFTKDSLYRICINNNYSHPIASDHPKLDIDVYKYYCFFNKIFIDYNDLGFGQIRKKIEEDSIMVFVGDLELYPRDSIFKSGFIIRNDSIIPSEMPEKYSIFINNKLWKTKIE